MPFRTASCFRVVLIVVALLAAMIQASPSAEARPKPIDLSPKNPVAIGPKGAVTPAVADLEITNITINNCEVSYSIINTGDLTAAGPFRAAISYGTNSAPWTTDSAWITNLAPGDVWQSPTFTIPSASEVTGLTITADPQNWVNESDETNNIANGAIPANCAGQADLEITNITINNCQASYSIINTGDLTAAGPFRAAISYGTNSAPWTTDSAWITNLAPGDVWQSPTFTIPSASEVTGLTITADPQNWVNESDETNNIANGAIPANC